MAAPRITVRCPRGHEISTGVRGRGVSCRCGATVYVRADGTTRRAVGHVNSELPERDPAAAPVDPAPRAAAIRKQLGWPSAGRAHPARGHSQDRMASSPASEHRSTPLGGAVVVRLRPRSADLFPGIY